MQIVLKADSEASQEIEVTVTNDGMDNPNYVVLLIADHKANTITDIQVSAADLYAAAQVFECKRKEAVDERRHYDSIETRRGHRP